MTPIVPTPVTGDAGASDADASTSSPLTSTDAGTAARTDAAAGETSTAVALDGPQWLLFGRGHVGAADVGGRNGTIFAYDSIGQFGDYINFGLAAGVLRDLNDGAFRVRLGGSLGYDRFNGGENTSGSHINIFSLNPRLELDWRRAYGSGPVAGPSRLGIEFGLGYGFGTTNVDGRSQLHDQSGFALMPRADLNLVNFRIGGMEMGLDFYAGTSAVLGTTHNSAFAEFGGQITFRSPFAEPTPVVEEACNLDRRGDLARRITQLQTESQGLREENASNASFLESIRTQLLAQGVSSDDIRTSLRTGLSTHIEAQQGGETPTPNTEILAQLRRLYASYLRGRAENPVADVAERNRLALEQFPDNYDLSTAENRAAAAQAVFPDDFDPYTWPEIASVEVPEPLPTDCDDLENLRNRLEDERADLREQKGLIDGLVRMGLVRLGVPAGSGPSLIRTISRLSEIHFITARPMGAPDRVSVSDADIAPINAAAEAWGRDHRGEVRAQTEIEAAFRAIFPRTRRAPGDTTAGRAEEYSPSLEVIRGVAETLRAPDMRGAHFYIVGHTDSRGDDAMNQRLSLRRAQAIRDALIFYGVDPAMITPLGRGESNLVYYYDRQTPASDTHTVGRAEIRMLRGDGITGTALADEIRGRQATNRRIEMFVCMPNSTDPICTALDTEVRASAAPLSAGSADGGVGSPIRSIVTDLPADAGAGRGRAGRGGTPGADAGADRTGGTGADAGGPVRRADE